MEYEWTSSSEFSWHLLGPHDINRDVRPSVAVAFKYYGSGWKGMVHSNRENPEDVLFIHEEHTLEEMKALIETTVALRG